MKQLFLFLVAVAVLQISCEKEVAKPVVLAENISYSVFADNNDGNLPILSQFYYADFASEILENIKNNKLQTHEFAGSNAITYDKINENIKSILTQNSIQKTPKEALNELIFNESWNIDTTTFKIDKKVKDLSFAVRYLIPIDSTSSKFVKDPVFTVMLNDSVKSESPKTISIKAEYIVKLSSCDSLFTKLSGFDTKTFVKSLINKTLKNEIIPYDYFSESPKVLSKEDILVSLDANDDSVEIEDATTGEMIPVIVKGEVDYEAITELVFIEKWTFDYEKNIFSKEILGYGPVREYYKANMPEMKVKSVPFILRFDVPKKNS